MKFGGGPTPRDFDEALRALGEGEIDGVAGAFDRLADPSAGLRTLIWPGRDRSRARSDG